MSLESNLELNNKLVAEQNGLLSQLLAALAGGKTFTADTPHQPKAETPVDKKDSAGPFYLRRTADGALNQVGTESARDSILRWLCRNRQSAVPAAEGRSRKNTGQAGLPRRTAAASRCGAGGAVRPSKPNA